MEPSSRPPESDAAAYLAGTTAPKELPGFEGAPAGRATIDENGGAVRRTVVVHADLETVWETIADATLRSEWDDGVLGDPLEEEHPHTIQFTGTEAVTVANITLHEERGGVRIAVAHDDFRHAYPDAPERHRALDSAARYWNDALDRLAAVLEKQDSQ